MKAGLRTDVAPEGGRLAVVSSGASSISEVPGRVGDLDEASAVRHEP